jgi:predicted  nucleic acid-binding Zn-ribbon protein
MANITKEQLDKVVSQQSELSKVLNDIGALEANKHSLLHKIADINKEIEQTKVELEKEYGAINIDLKTGEYTIIETKDDGELAVVKAED